MYEVGYHNPVIQEDLATISSSKALDWNRFNGKTVLITGSYGMLASYLVYLMCYLNDRCGIAVNIVACGRSLDKAKKRFGSLLEKEYFTFLEMSAEDVLGDDVPHADFVIHAASPASGQYYDLIPVDIFTTNVLGAIRTLDFARRCKSERYLLVSSGEVYGVVEGDALLEGRYGSLDPTSVRSCYGEGKRGAECLLSCYGKQYGVSGSSVRPSHTYGPTMDIANDQRVFSSFVANVLNHSDIVLKSDGTALRSFCYIADATLAYVKVLLDGEPSTAYNVACAKGTISIRDLAEGLANQYGLDAVFAQRSESYLENSFKLQPQMKVDRLAGLGVSCNTLPQEGFSRTIRAFQEGI